MIQLKDDGVRAIMSVIVTPEQLLELPDGSDQEVRIGPSSIQCALEEVEPVPDGFSVTMVLNLEDEIDKVEAMVSLLRCKEYAKQIVAQLGKEILADFVTAEEASGIAIPFPGSEGDGVALHNLKMGKWTTKALSTKEGFIITGHHKDLLDFQPSDEEYNEESVKPPCKVMGLTREDSDAGRALMIAFKVQLPRLMKVLNDNPIVVSGLPKMRRVR